ncbi:hypothetical protein ACLVWU_17680 [Bdellovibrio sp. HCB290]|uniref:hypothetical protein n=1 Tax=Bdellovibrio sp. HCB290 TaxID=3394356 RepID=UPI0039B58D8D
MTNQKAKATIFQVNISKLNILILVGVFILVAMLASQRYYYLSTQNEICQIQKTQFSHELCSPEGQLSDWKQIEGLVQVRIPPANSNAEAYLVKKELTNVEWVEHPGWFGFKYNCIFDQVILVQNNQCQIL